MPADTDAAPFRLEPSHIAAVVESAMDAIISVDDAQRIVLFNPAAERMFGVPAREALGGPLHRFLPERFRASHREHVKAFAETNVTTRSMGALRPLAALRGDGTEFPIEASISRVEAGGRRTLTVILRDVSERVRAEQMLAGYTREIEASREALRALSAKLHETRESERAHIAREVHDRLGQALTAVSLGLERLVGELDRHDRAAVAAARKECRSLAALVDDTLQATRRLASELHPAVLDHLGLAAAVEWHAGDFAARAALTCDLDVDSTMSVPAPYELPLFRVLQEALTNVVRHAGARRVWVVLRQADDAIELVVDDDGRGVAETPRGHSLGLLGMRERLVPFGGSVSLTRRPGGGARLVARVPGACAGEEGR